MKATAISPTDLRREIAGANPPIVIDVRRRPAFLEAEAMLSGALRREPDEAGAWAKSLPAASAVVVYCVHGHEVSQGAAAALQETGIAARYLEGGLAGWKEAEGALDHKPRNGSTRWVTRERPKIDRIACPWLIRRFIDPLAAFDYVPTPRVFDEARARSAVPYDIPGAVVTHRGERCSFDALIEDFDLHDPALDRLASIVRGADTDRLDLAPQSRELLAASMDLSARFRDDHEMLEAAMPMYDALYASCRAR